MPVSSAATLQHILHPWGPPPLSRTISVTWFIEPFPYFEHLFSLLRITLGNCVNEKEQFIIAEICVFQITVSPQQAAAAR